MQAEVLMYLYVFTILNDFVNLVIWGPWDRETSSSGYSYNHKSEREAKVEALNQCGRDRCEIMTSFRNECGALAIGKKNTVAMTGATRAEAETKALRKCGPECRPVAWACTR